MTSPSPLERLAQSGLLAREPFDDRIVADLVDACRKVAEGVARLELPPKP